VKSRGLKVIGPYKGSSGYDRHTREFVRAFANMGVSIELRNLDGWSTELPAAARDPWFDGLTQPVDADTVLHFTMPNHARPEPGRRNVNYTMFEADRIPAAWVELARGHDMIVLPTEAAFRAWADSGVPEQRLRVSPLGVDAPYFSQPCRPLAITTRDGRPLSSFRTRFLNVAELRPRKNHLGLLRAWMRATGPADDAVLILKVSVFQARALAQFQADVADMQRRLGRSLNNAAAIVVIADQLSDAAIRALYGSATHYISMSHGEGWDLPMMEAAVSGLSLIAPRHTAYMSYLRDDEAWFVPAPAGPARLEGRMGREDQMFFDRLSWWLPDEEAAAEIIRAIVRGDAPSKRSPKDRIAMTYTWENAVNRLAETIFDKRQPGPR
jgi:glycosyltransferase involved in cell wall biosynthesis